VPSAGNESAMTRAPHVRNRATTGTPLGLTRARQQIQGQRCLLDFRRSPSGIAPASASAGTYLPIVPDLPSRVRSSVGPHRLDSDPDGPRTHFLGSTHKEPCRRGLRTRSLVGGSRGAGVRAEREPRAPRMGTRERLGQSVGSMSGTLVIATAVLLAACTSLGPPHPKKPSGAEDVAPFIRECDTAVFGDPNMKNAVRIGPLVLVGIPQAAKLSPRAFKPHEGRYGAIKLLAIVEESSDLTLTVPRSQRDSVSLLYNEGARANKNGFLFSAGDPRVTFQACPGMEPQYNGGFIATRPSCVSLEVQSKAATTSGRISLGAGRSCLS
jgi:hypothetical protein